MKTLKQAEELTGIKASTLRQRINRKTLKAIKIGKTYVLTTKELNKLLKAQKEPTKE